MSIRFYNARILPLNNDDNIIEGELWTDDGKIVYLGSGEKMPEKPVFEREIDCNGNLLMPGFKNAHTHSAMTFLRSYADDLPLQEWLFNRVFPMEAKLTADDNYWLTKLAILEYLTGGTTSCFDMYFFPEGVAPAAAEMGYRFVFCGSISGDKSNITRLQNYYETYNKYNPLISYKLGFHAEYTTELETMKEIAKLSKALKEPVFVHNSETEKEVRECVEKYGKTPTALFDSLGIYDNGGGGFHCVHMSNEDLRIFKEKKLWAVTNPGSNAKLASGVAPICRMQEMGINLAIGTDGPASNNCLDMFKEMFLVTGLQKIINKDASACDAISVLRMAACGGAKAMGLSDSDCLAEGKNADLIVIDLHQPNMHPLNNIEKNVVYSGSKQNVKLTMVNGKILYENGEFFVGESAERIYEKANEIINRMR